MTGQKNEGFSSDVVKQQCSPVMGNTSPFVFRLLGEQVGAARLSSSPALAPPRHGDWSCRGWPALPREAQRRERGERERRGVTVDDDGCISTWPACRAPGSACTAPRQTIIHQSTERPRKPSHSSSDTWRDREVLIGYDLTACDVMGVPWNVARGFMMTCIALHWTRQDKRREERERLFVVSFGPPTAVHSHRWSRIRFTNPELHSSWSSPTCC